LSFFQRVQTPSTWTLSHSIFPETRTLITCNFYELNLKNQQETRKTKQKLFTIFKSTESSPTYTTEYEGHRAASGCEGKQLIEQDSVLPSRSSLPLNSIVGQFIPINFITILATYSNNGNYYYYYYYY
jgi:hypothetical protein